MGIPCLERRSLYRNGVLDSYNNNQMAGAANCRAVYQTHVQP